jgi:hypothetical protein
MVIYKTTNLINGKIYVGKSKDNNPKYLGSGKIIREAISKYGKDNFEKEILEYCETPYELNTKEREWILKLNTQDNNIGYNITAGGDGNSGKWNGEHLSETHRENISKGLKNSEKVKKMWDNGHRDKLSFARKESDNVKQLISNVEWRNKISSTLKISELAKSNYDSIERNNKISDKLNDPTGKFQLFVQSKEFKEKCSAWQKDKPRTEEYMVKFRETREKNTEKRQTADKEILIECLLKNNNNLEKVSHELNMGLGLVKRKMKKYNIYEQKTNK